MVPNPVWKNSTCSSEYVGGDLPGQTGRAEKEQSSLPLLIKSLQHTDTAPSYYLLDICNDPQALKMNYKVG